MNVSRAAHLIANVSHWLKAAVETMLPSAQSMSPVSPGATSHFISLDNMRGIVDRVSRELPSHDRRAADLALGAQSEAPQVKQVVYDMMVDVARDDELAGLGTATMNQVVVNATMQYYQDLLLQTSREDVAPTQDSAEAPTFADAVVSNMAPGAAESSRSTPLHTYLSDPSAPQASSLQVVDAGSSRLTEEQKRVVEQEEGPVGNEGRNEEEQQKEILSWCISIDGQHRDMSKSTSRYQFITDLGDSIRNVKSIKTESVVLPIQDHNVNAPFLLLVVDELPGAYIYNNNDPVRRAFSKLVPESSYTSARGRTYSVLKPAAQDSRAFDPPMPALSRLTVRLTRPDGAIVSDSRDTLRVHKIVKSSDGNWILVFDRFWEVKEFDKGDIVRLTGCNTKVDAVDQHINRDQGHEVLSLGMPLAEEGCNKIVIRYAGYLDNSTGDFVQNPQADPAFDGSHTDSDAVGEIATDCAIINLSLQMSATLTASCEVAALPSGKEFLR